MRARAVLAKRLGDDVPTRHLIKEPLTKKELKAIAAEVGGPEALVAPKRRKEAEGMTGDALLTWLAADGGRVRRPIVVTPKGITVGFAAEQQEQLARLLGAGRR